MPQMHKLGKGNTTFCRTLGCLIVTYHSTAVVTVDAGGMVRLDNGGWQTASTKTRMNQAAAQFNLGFNVAQKGGKWSVRTPAGDVVPFLDGKAVFQGKELSA
jgi:hypothetical protein